MRISTKGRYGLAAMILMSQNDSDEFITVISMAENLGISKIYLEQVFSLLKKSKLVISTKGAQGGYRLARKSNEITAFEILSAIDSLLFEKTDSTVVDKAPNIETAMSNLIFEPLDSVVEHFLKTKTLFDLLEEVQKHSKNGFMYYI